jgi:hypothetical protein
MIVSEADMFSLGGMRPLVAGAAACAIALAPLTARAAATPSIDSLWNQADGISMDSALYVFQSWWDGFNRHVSDNPTQRGLDELSQANADLLNAYTLLQKAHSGSGPQPVAIIDPLLASIYDPLTGSTAKAPIGSLFSGLNHSLLKMENRDSTADLVRALLQDYRAKQAVAVRDLHLHGSNTYDGLLAGNAQREADFLTRLQLTSAPDDGLASLLNDANQQTTALAGKGNSSQTASAHASGNSHGPANSHGQSEGKGKNTPGDGKKN